MNEARGEPVWWQLYPSVDWDVTSGMIARVESAGCPVMLLTVDLQGGSNRERLERGRRADDRDCSVCHTEANRRPIYRGLDLSNRGLARPLDMTWEYFARLKEATSMKLGIKGIVTREDAELCVQYGADVIVVSNHGGRAEASARSTIECLPEIVEAVDGRIPIVIDSGFRRGTDIFKALALGAPRSGSGARIFGAWRHSGRKASRRCSNSCAVNSGSSCARRAPRRSIGSASSI